MGQATMTIKKEGTQYVVRSKKGRNLGKSGSLAGAQKRLSEVEAFKHFKKKGRT